MSPTDIVATRLADLDLPVESQKALQKVLRNRIRVGPSENDCTGKFERQQGGMAGTDNKWKRSYIYMYKHEADDEKYKIGKHTGPHPHNRMEQSEIWCCKLITLVYYKEVPFDSLAEGLVHSELRARNMWLGQKVQCVGRGHCHREWFRGSPTELRDVIDFWTNYIERETHQGGRWHKEAAKYRELQHAAAPLLPVLPDTPHARQQASDLKMDVEHVKMLLELELKQQAQSLRMTRRWAKEANELVGRLKLQVEEARARAAAAAAQHHQVHQASPAVAAPAVPAQPGVAVPSTPCPPAGTPKEGGEGRCQGNGYLPRSINFE